VGQDIADDRETRSGADDVRARGRHELAVDAQAVVDAIGDGRRGQPRGEAELVEPVELADLDGEQARDLARVGPEMGLVDPHADHRRPRVHPVEHTDRRQLLGPGGDVRGTRPDQVAQDPLDALVVAHHEQRLR